MPESQPESYTFRVNAELLAPGQIPVHESTPLAPVRDSSVENDDFGVPALVHLVLEDGMTLRLAYGSSVRVQALHPPARPRMLCARCPLRRKITPRPLQPLPPHTRITAACRTFPSGWAVA
ncbi:hypothetical protein OL239_18750 [Arthrobacter sp. ATA002]|nr:hypothetical protein OL239_18750 [Arthrobacter sp. ATA002]